MKPLAAAAVQLTRARIAAQRLFDLTPATPDAQPAKADNVESRAGRLHAAEIRAGYPGAAGSPPMTVELAPGARLTVTGPSGSGKTSLLMTLAGLLPPLAGDVSLDNMPLNRLGETQLRSAVCFFAEDAHIFATTIRDNLMVARGDCLDDELTAALNHAGPGRWLESVPDGLATVLSGGASSVSAGQRRRSPCSLHCLTPTADFSQRSERWCWQPTTCPTTFTVGNYVSAPAGTLAADRPHPPDLECES